jgi:hypothetical protein
MTDQFTISSIPHNIYRLYCTLKHLKWQQIYYRFYYPIKRIWYRPRKPSSQNIQCAHDFPKITFQSFAVHQNLFDATKNTFFLLQIKHSFGAKTDWNYSKYGMLWAYHLNYFDWLNDDNLSVALRLATIQQYIEQASEIKIGHAAYPSSIRIVNWIKFLSQHQIHDEHISKSLYLQAHRLFHFPEYQLLANHLLVNAWAIIWAAIYFDDKSFLNKGVEILQKELDEQILIDGAHYERSTMYHAIILQYLLELNIIIEAKKTEISPTFCKLLKEKTVKMLSWAEAMRFGNDLLPNFGDSTAKVTPMLKELKIVARSLNLIEEPIIFSECGYRKIKKNKLELFFNCGEINPSYQPGHAHADIFSFCLNINGQPIVVDTGISTYERNKQRNYERSTAAHNTVCLENTNSSDIWASFRVGNRAKVEILEDNELTINAVHDGYKRKFGIIHNRNVALEGNKVIIIDQLDGWKGQSTNLFLHFHPDININKEQDFWVVEGLKIKIEINCTNVRIENYQYCETFNTYKSAKRLVAQVNAQTCTTVIEYIS